MNRSSSDIVIGIDFGTTYSGVCWAYPGRRDVRLITNWPNPKCLNASNDKVPSTISYKGGQVHKWGYSNNDPREEVIQWFKILLEPSHKYNEEVQEVKNSSKILKKLDKLPEQVVADYLRRLWEFTMEDIRREVSEDNLKHDYTRQVVITVPAMWSDAAKEKTKKAAKMAGIDGKITVITEPEAAALSVLQDKADNDTLNIGDTFVVCDSGGGTVDLISYTVQSLEPLELEETVKGEGGLCGSVYLNIGFQKYIETFVGKEQYDSLKPSAKTKMMNEFDQNLKRMFNEKSNDTYAIDLYGVKDDAANGIDDNMITLKKSVLKGIFDKVFLDIQALVSNQIAQIKKQNKKVKAILLVGGFGESSYLHDRMEACHLSEGIRIFRVQGAWSSICRGAALAGLQGVGGALGRAPKVTSRIARYSYGFLVSEVFDSNRHIEVDRYLCPSEGIHRANNQMLWALKVGDKVDEGKIITHQVYDSVQVGFWDSVLDTEDRKFSTQLYCSEDPTPPTRLVTSVNKLCEVSYSISCTKLWIEDSYRSPLTNKKWRNCTFDLHILLKKGSLDFAVMYKNEVLGAVEAAYKEDF